jgi:uroporphyrinogen decarboxylase
MDHKERMLTAIYERGVPDKVPHGDVMVDPKVMSKLLGCQVLPEYVNYLIFWMTEPFDDDFFNKELRVREMLAFDFAHVFPREPLKKIGENEEGYPIVRDIWGAEYIITPTTWIGLKAPVSDLRKVEEYKFPEVKDFSFDNLERWVRESDLFVVAQLDTGFFKIAQLIGFEQYMLAVAEGRTKEIKLLMERLTTLQIKLAQECIRRGADCIWLANDFAWNGGPFINPEMLWELDFQYEQEIIKAVHKMGVPCVLHACGNQNKTIDMIVEMGVDGIHALQPAAGNNIFQLRKRYGNRICLLGNVDISNLLPFGSPWDVDQMVRELIENVGKDGAYVLTTANAICGDVPVENAIILHLAVEKYGHYTKKHGHYTKEGVRKGV